MDEPLYRCWTKATTRESGVPRRSTNWITSRRARLKVFPDRLECRDWTIPVDAIDHAVLYHGRSFLVPAHVLELRCGANTYQFGLNPWVRLDRHLPFEVEHQHVRFGFSPVAAAIRVAAFGYLLYWVWQRFR